jgi:lipid A oxidase
VLRFALVPLVTLFGLLSTRPAEGEWSMTAYLGVTNTRPSTLHLARPAAGTDIVLGPVTYAGDSFSPPVYYGARAGYFFRAHVGLEAELIHAKVFTDPMEIVARAGQLDGRPVSAPAPLGDVVQRFSISHGLNLLFANIVLRTSGRPQDDRRVTWLARVGLGPTMPHGESSIAGASREQYELGRVAVQVAGGVELRAFKQARAIAEYKLTHTSQHVAVAGGTVDARFTTHHMVFGLGYRF